MKFIGTKNELRRLLAVASKNAQLNIQAATAIMNDWVEWHDNVGYCKYYNISIGRGTLLDSSTIVVKWVKQGTMEDSPIEDCI